MSDTKVLADAKRTAYARPSDVVAWGMQRTATAMVSTQS